MQLVPAPRSPVPFFFSHWPLATAPLECESAFSKKGSSRAEPREAWRSTLSFLAPCPFFLFTQALKLSDTHLLFTGHGVCHCEQQTPTSSGVIDGKNIVNPSLRGAPATKQSHENDCTRIEALFRTFFHFPHFFHVCHFSHCVVVTVFQPGICGRIFNMKRIVAISANTEPVPAMEKETP